MLSDRADIYIICLQEIVQLNATQIVSSDPERRQLWESVFLEALDEYFGHGCYVTLISNQLVGTSLTVFIHSRLVDDIKNVEVCSIKTGLGGFEISNNSFCIIGSHFTAGIPFYALYKHSFSFCVKVKVLLQTD
jgi:synaptojanin